jgi:hypothetical protein
MFRQALLSAALIGAALPSLAQEPKLPYKIHSIVSVERVEANLYSFETVGGQFLEVAASDAGVAHDLMNSDAFSQDYHCAMQPLSDDQYHIVGCSGVGVPGPLRLP